MTKAINIKINQTNLPIIKMAGQKSGPTIFIIAGIHGDEIGATLVAKKIIKKLKNNLLSGTVYVLPAANPWGLKRNARKIPQTKEDLNRSFPGKSRGSLGQKTAYQIFSLIKQARPDLVLDLHNDWPDSLPYLTVDPKKLCRDIKIYQDTLMFAKSSRLLVVKEKDNPDNLKMLKKTLSGNCLMNNIPALTLELGEAKKNNRINIAAAAKVVLNILSRLKMVSGKTKNLPWPSKILKYEDWPKSPRSGRIKFFVKAGEMVKKNQLLAKISKINLIAKNDGIILGTTDKKMVKGGETIIASGLN